MIPSKMDPDTIYIIIKQFWSQEIKIKRFPSSDSLELTVDLEYYSNHKTKCDYNYWHVEKKLKQFGVKATLNYRWVSFEDSEQLEELMAAGFEIPSKKGKKSFRQAFVRYTVESTDIREKPGYLEHQALTQPCEKTIHNSLFIPPSVRDIELAQLYGLI